MTTNKLIESGSIWTGSEGTRFQVIKEIELEGHTWIHYRTIVNHEPKEFSCYKESFIERFHQVPKE